MKIKRDVFRIESGAREADGTKLEPEQQAVQHIFEGAAPVGVGAGLDIVDGDGARGSMPLEIIAHSTAQQTARSVSALCANCKWWSNEAWRRMLANAERPDASPAERHSVREIRAQILLHMPEADKHVGDDGDYDVEHAMQSMGLCPALKEFYKTKGEPEEPVAMWPTAGCPTETCTPDKPMGLFLPRDGDARKASAANFDAVMQRAAGKIL